MRFNLGVMLIRVGYFVKGLRWKPAKFSFRWWVGGKINRFGYYLRTNNGYNWKKLWKINN